MKELLFTLSIDRSCHLLHHINALGVVSQILITNISINIPRYTHASSKTWKQHNRKNTVLEVRNPCVRQLPIMLPGQFTEFLQICLHTCKKMEDWFMCMTSEVNSNSEILDIMFVITNLQDVF